VEGETDGECECDCETDDTRDMVRVDGVRETDVGKWRDEGGADDSEIVGG